MNTSQRYIGIAASIALLIYLVAVWSEAAYEASDIGFNEELTWSRMLVAYRLTAFADMLELETLPMGVVAVVGMLASIMSAFVLNRTFSIWSLFAYVIVLIIAGGWMGMFALVFIPFDILDGEFLAEGLARVTATGIWAILVISLLVHQVVKLKNSTEQDADNRRSAGA